MTPDPFECAHRDILPNQIIPQTLEELHAVHVWHHHVQQDHTHIVQRQEVESGFATPSRCRPETQALNDPHQNRANIRVVIYYKHGLIHRHHFSCYRRTRECGREKSGKPEIALQLDGGDTGKARFDHVLLKPIAYEELQSLIRQVGQGSEQEVEKVFS
jgi:hypothetical protein